MKSRLLWFVAFGTLITAPLFSVAAPKENAPATPPAKAPAETGYWITTSSGVRHNAKCRYYKNSKGRFCTKDEGRACKICGG